MAMCGEWTGTIKCSFSCPHIFPCCLWVLLRGSALYSPMSSPSPWTLLRSLPDRLRTGIAHCWPVGIRVVTPSMFELGHSNSHLSDSVPLDTKMTTLGCVVFSWLHLRPLTSCSPLPRLRSTRRQATPLLLEIPFPITLPTLTSSHPGPPCSESPWGKHSLESLVHSSDPHGHLPEQLWATPGTYVVALFPEMQALRKEPCLMPFCSLTSPVYRRCQ